MATSNLTIDEILNYFKVNNDVVLNRDLVHHFKSYLTNPVSKEDARIKFKKYVNTLAHSQTQDDVKYLMLKTKYKSPAEFSPHSLSVPPQSPQYDPRNSIGIPVVSPIAVDFVTPTKSPSRQPPPYRAPPPPFLSPYSDSVDNISLGSIMSLQDAIPQPPPRRRSAADRQKSLDEAEAPLTPKRSHSSDILNNNHGDGKVSVRERLEKFNRMASVEDELTGSPRQPKSAEKSRIGKGVEEDDVASVTSLEPKKCTEWYVAMSRADVQELSKLAKDEPRLVNRKDPFTSVLHWGAKRGNPEIIKIFAGRYKVEVNSRTGYTPLHFAAQFGHDHIYELLVKGYNADQTIRDYSGKLPIHYKKNRKGESTANSKIKSRKKQSDKDLGFLRIGSLNVRVKKTTEAFSNFLGVGGGGSINPLDGMDEKMHKGWGSADNLNQEIEVNKGLVKKKTKRPHSSGLNSTPGTPKELTRSVNPRLIGNESDSDSAAGFDSQWKN